MPVKIGIICGSGLNDLNLFEDKVEKEYNTPYGKPSDVLSFGKINGVECVLLPRHDKKHSLMPTNINYRANIYALKKAGCTHVIATSACGSLQEKCHPGDLVIIDQFIDRTTKRPSTFYDGQSGHLEGVCHIPMDKPFCEPLRQILIESSKTLGIHCHTKGTVVTIEGPRFSSKAESKLFQSWGCDIINMTTVPEVCLAKEIGVLYSTVCLVTDYDCWKDDGVVVSVDSVLEIFKENIDKAIRLIVAAIPKIAERNWSKEELQLKDCIKMHLWR
ncbi:S-methyl-5'-thioadenosine phosphorylase-like isoform X2 [Xenia sp. Carnegie-2017]|uniref:S-methyl-5'-thioadenosine phosphorylase-like isoform X2 n=1 Tax=Xenia sp. Carnegie-2017 TaxID=2897299 RepID=UPI001F033DE5|nr:S-methyl-5'-thioadenosine phosphorylase-like isoform X2 [Xenia sp. Carnegie-2017]